MKCPKMTRSLIAFLCLMPFPIKAETTPEVGKKEATQIAIAKDATAPELAAAEDLSLLLKKATNSEFQIVEESQVDQNHPTIYVGQTKYARDSGIDFSKIEQEEWIIKSQNARSLILGGGRPRGTQYAVYEFLEKQLGYRWFDEHTEMVPSISELRFPPLDLKGKPHFQFRWFYDLMDWYPVSGTFKLRNKGFSYTQTENGMANILGRPGPHHTFYHYSKNWPADKPELFSMDKEGKRLIATSGLGPGQICMSNPEGRKRVLEELRQFIKADRKEAEAVHRPYPVVYDISINDNVDKCECPECRRVAAIEGESGLLLSFINEIADSIKGEFPDIFVRTFAYVFVTDPPKRIKAAENVIIQIAVLGVEFGNGYYPRDTLRSILSPENSYIRNLIQGWSDKASNLTIWDYWIPYPPVPEPFVKVGSIQDDIEFFRKNNVTHLFIERENPPFSNFFGLTRYIGYKIMDDPTVSVKKLTEEYLRAFYGEAWKPMLELLNYMQARQDNSVGKISELDISVREYLDLEYFKTALGLLEQAEQAAGDNETWKAHVRLERVAIIGGLLHRWNNLENPGSVFNGSQLLQEFSEDAKRAIDYYFPNPDPKNFREECEKTLAESIKRYELNIHELAPLTEFAGQDIIDVPLSVYSSEEPAALVSDPAAARGMAVVLTFKDKNDDPQNKTKREKTEFGVWDWMDSKSLFSTSIVNTDLKASEKYKLIKIGQLTFPNNSRAWFYAGSRKWGIRFDLYRLVLPNTSCEIYASIRTEGPAYGGSAEGKNRLLIDRVFLVKSKPIN